MHFRLVQRYGFCCFTTFMTVFTFKSISSFSNLFLIMFRLLICSEFKKPLLRLICMLFCLLLIFFKLVICSIFYYVSNCASFNLFHPSNESRGENELKKEKVYNIPGRYICLVHLSISTYTREVNEIEHNGLCNTPNLGSLRENKVCRFSNDITYKVYKIILPCTLLLLSNFNYNRIA